MVLILSNPNPQFNSTSEIDKMVENGQKKERKLG